VDGACVPEEAEGGATGSGGSAGSTPAMTAGTTGTAGSRGGDPTNGGEPSTGGTPSSAGATSLGGQPGAAGSGNPLHGNLGDPCPAEGDTICPGYAADYSLLCSADLVWEADDSCYFAYSDYACDSELGVCVQTSPYCSGPGDRYCDDTTVMECNLDGTRSFEIAECELVCHAAECRNDADPCPAPDELYRDCSETCPEIDVLGDCESSPYHECDTTLVRFPDDAAVGDVLYARTRWGKGDEEDPECSCGEGRYWTEFYPELTDEGLAHRVTVPDPWWLVPKASHDASDAYECESDSKLQCVVVEKRDLEPFVLVVTDDPNAPARNIQVEVVQEGATCP
jgi:hypothetical protein